MTCEEILRKYNVWSRDLEVDLLREFVEKQRVAPAQQATNSRYATALSVVDEFLKEPLAKEMMTMDGFWHWLERLNAAESAPHSA